MSNAQIIAKALGSLAQKNTVGTTDIDNSSVTGAKITDLTVNTADIADNAVTPVKLSQKITQGTAQATTSGTSIDFTTIPSWVKRITVVLNGVSNSAGAGALMVQLGAGSVETTGYVSSAVYAAGTNTVGGLTFTNGFGGTTALAASTLVSGVITLVNISGNNWVASGVLHPQGLGCYSCSGSKTLSGVLDRLRITFHNGTDTFDAGSVNIIYE